MSDAAIFSGLGGFIFLIAITVALYRIKCIRVDVWQIRKDVSDIRDILGKESNYFPAERHFEKPDNRPYEKHTSTNEPSAGLTPTEGKGWKL